MPCSLGSRQTIELLLAQVCQNNSGSLPLQVMLYISKRGSVGKFGFGLVDMFPGGAELRSQSINSTTPGRGAIILAHGVYSDSSLERAGGTTSALHPSASQILLSLNLMIGTFCVGILAGSSARPNFVGNSVG